MNTLATVNLILSFILLVLNTGGFLHFFRARADKGNRFTKAALLLVTGAIEIVLISIFAGIILRALGIDGETVALITSTNGFIALVLLLMFEVILLLLTKDRLK